MIDTHAHLHVHVYDRDRKVVLDRSFHAGLKALLEVNIDPGGWPEARRLAHSDPRVFLTVGAHPHEAGRIEPEAVEELLAEAGDPRVRAIGETGLDNYRNYAPRDQQRRLFQRHVAAAVETGLPLVVHLRSPQGEHTAHDEALRILRTEGKGRLRGVFHCFAGGLAQAREAVELGFNLGLGGAITYSPERSAPLLRTIFQELGPEVFVLETDCPYLTPHPRRRDRNEPAQIPVIAQALAAYLGVAPREVERMTDAAARELFRLEE
jgi:TatD DNase family protein